MIDLRSKSQKHKLSAIIKYMNYQIRNLTYIMPGSKEKTKR